MTADEKDGAVWGASKNKNQKSSLTWRIYAADAQITKITPSSIVSVGNNPFWTREVIADGLGERLKRNIMLNEHNFRLGFSVANVANDAYKMPLTY